MMSSLDSEVDGFYESHHNGVEERGMSGLDLGFCEAFDTVP